MASGPCTINVPELFNFGYTNSVNTRAFAMGIHTERRAERVLICRSLHGHWFVRERMISSGSIFKPISASFRVSRKVGINIPCLFALLLWLQWFWGGANGLAILVKFPITFFSWTQHLICEVNTGRCEESADTKNESGLDNRSTPRCTRKKYGDGLSYARNRR